ncbi:family 1 glycosylhydrolase [Streptomyces ficellus]|uniref:Family 1 glycosylhydrolase n=1 Tax=Streptomyces ficellus TaxID=1977088 RepID=A0ABT7ZAA1_9ACTN|nr:family 1 glycosylhydrolase [Streptomyces ficellus]MDN3296363.1 family 1 glycosylhydrolase [Streptomyces ficellus]
MHRDGQADLAPLPPVGRTFVAGFESTYLPMWHVDELDTTGHAAHPQRDIDEVLAAGVRHLRYPLRWQRINPAPGRYDWSETDRALGHLREHGAVPIVDLVHHTSYPDWLTDGFRDRGFADAYVTYAEAVARRYPWLPAYTLFNEPFATLFLAGHEALWPPYDRGVEGFTRLLCSVLPAVTEAARCWARLLPDARHVWVDTGEHHSGTGPGEAHARMANDRRHVVLDLVLGHDLDPERPFLSQLIAAGGERLLHLPALRVDVLGLDYYCHSEWFYDESGARAPSPRPIGLAEVLQQYGDRYGLPMMLSETNIRGLPSDRASWLRYTVEQYELALSRGLPLHGYCWFPQVDSCDWDSLLARPAGRADPVGVVSHGRGGSRRESTFTQVWQAAAAGAPVHDLPAYRFQSPCRQQLAGFLPAMAHWPWQEALPEDHVPPVHVPIEAKEPVVIDVPADPDLVVLSHLRWVWVWQRPQQLVSRLAAARADRGVKTWFVEEPVSGDVPVPQLRREDHGNVVRVWLVVPRAEGRPEFLCFDDPAADDYGRLLAEMLAGEGRPAAPDVWLYTPMALDTARALRPGRVIYDVMDDLAAFLGASPALRRRQGELLRTADIVFTGGRSLHRSVADRRTHDIHCFPSGVDTAHFTRARTLRRPHDRPVAGYVGVIDERLDLDLLRGLSSELPDWTIRMVGPVTKIDPSTVPRAANLHYAGLTPYEELPRELAGFDVALMPFALNEATRSISPTKTLEYLVAGLPVISTRVPDVVADYSDIVHFADTAAGFADACREVVQQSLADRDRHLRPVQHRHEWDVIAASMAALIDKIEPMPPVCPAETTAG